MGPNVGGHIAPWSLIREILVQTRCYIYIVLKLISRAIE